MITTRQGAEAERGGLDLTISLTADQADALGVDAQRLVDYLDTVLVQMAAFRMRRDPVLPALRTVAAVPARQVVGEVGAKDRPLFQGVRWDERVLQEVSALLTLLGGVRDATLRTHAGHGGSISQAGYAMGVSKATAQTRRNALRGPSPAELRVVGAYAGVRDPGANVPAVMRPWSVAWPGYTPANLNPSELLAGLTGSVGEGSVEAIQTPDDVPPAEWLRRSAAALVPFDLDDRSWPLNPGGRTGRTGKTSQLRHTAAPTPLPRGRAPQHVQLPAVERHQSWVSRNFGEKGQTSVKASRGTPGGKALEIETYTSPHGSVSFQSSN